MENHDDIRVLRSHIEQKVGMLLEEIEKMKKTIISNAKQEAMIELHKAKKLSNEIVKNAVRQRQKFLIEFKQKLGTSNLEKKDSDIEFW